MLWTFEPIERGAIISSPLVSEEKIYVATIEDHGLSNSGMVYCLDRDTGNILWKFNDDGAMQHMYSSPCLANGRLYVGEGMHANDVCKLYCLDAASGLKRWHFVTAGHIESSPCVAEGKVYFGSGDDGLYCLDAVTGKKCWHFRGPYHIDTSPAVVGKFVYAGSGVSLLHRTTEAFCLDADRGRVVWRLPTHLPVWGSPRVDGGQVFFGLGNGRLNQSAPAPETPAGALLCVDATSGRRLWRFDVEDAVLARPAVDARHVYFAARDGFCYCLERHTGRQLWKQHLGSAAVTNPLLLGERLYLVASGGLVSCLRAGTGKTIWTFDVAGFSQLKPQLLSSPSAVSATTDGQQYRRIYFGAELQNPAGHAAVLYCLQD